MQMNQIKFNKKIRKLNQILKKVINVKRIIIKIKREKQELNMLSNKNNSYYQQHKAFINLKEINQVR